MVVAKNNFFVMGSYRNRSSSKDLMSINSNNLKVHPLNVVNDPQKPNPKINLYLLDFTKLLIKPNKKQPTKFTI